jgi:hypothetical protein
MPFPSDPSAPWSNAPFTPAQMDHIIDLIATRHHLRRSDVEKLVASPAPKRNLYLEKQWVELSHRMCEAIRSGRAKPPGLFESVFWIRLYGCLTDLREMFEKWTDVHIDVSPSWPPYRFLAAAAEVAAACEALHGCLSDDELAYVAFLRHVHAHVYQEGFQYAIERGNPEKNQRGALRTKQTVRPLRRHVDVDEVHAIVNRVYEEHGGDEHKIARVFADKVSASLERLDRAMTELQTARDETK